MELLDRYYMPDFDASCQERSWGVNCDWFTDWMVADWSFRPIGDIGPRGLNGREVPEADIN